VRALTCGVVTWMKMEPTMICPSGIAFVLHEMMRLSHVILWASRQ
jgi:hypothetical protein